MLKFHRFLPTAPLLLLACAAVAEPGSDGGSRDELLAMLAEQTELATKTRLNVDYVPGILDVLRGDELAGRGARTVWDALGFVPGINPVIDQLGHPRIIVRGLGTIGDAWYSGYIKILLNGVPMNTDERGLADPVLFLPIAQVERIEVIRGPGSAVHGEYAIAGVINVITRRDENRVFGFGGSFNERGGGVILDSRRGDLRLSVNLGLWQTDGANVLTGPDALYQMGLGSISHAPGHTNESTYAGNGVAQLDFKNFSVIAQWTDSQLGNFFGVNHELPPPGSNRVEDASIRQLEGHYRFDLLEGKVDFYGGTRTYRLKKDNLYSSPSEFYGVANGPDVLIDTDYQERRDHIGADTTWQLDAHKLLLGLYAAHVEVGQATAESTLINYGGYPVAKGTSREIRSIVLQDEYRASDVFSLTTGARYDDYSIVGGSINPRIAGVWRFGEEEVIKAQYARAFRPPTLAELAYGATNLRPTTVDTLELGYIRKFPRGEWRATTAYSELRDVILLDLQQAPTYFVNARSGRLRSVELEGERHLTNATSVQGSLAYTNTDLSDQNGPIPGSSDWLARLGLQHRFDSGVSGDLEYRWVSGFHRQANDPRPTANGFDSVDLTLSGNIAEGLTARAGISNLFDSDIRFPAFMGENQAYQPIVSYPGDLPRAGRTWWLLLSKRF